VTCLGSARDYGGADGRDGQGVPADLLLETSSGVEVAGCFATRRSDELCESKAPTKDLNVGGRCHGWSPRTQTERSERGRLFMLLAKPFHFGFKEDQYARFWPRGPLACFRSAATAGAVSGTG